MTISKSEETYLSKLIADARSLTPTHPSASDAFVFSFASLLHLVRAFPLPAEGAKAAPASKSRPTVRTGEDPVQKARRAPRTPFLPTSALPEKLPAPKRVKPKEASKVGRRASQVARLPDPKKPKSRKR